MAVLGAGQAVLPFIPYVSAPTNDLSTYIINAIANLPANHVLTQQDFITIFSQYVQTNQKIFLELSSTRIDIEYIKQQFISWLNKSDAWKDIIPAAGGGTVIDYLASIGGLGQDGIIIASQETNLDSATTTSGIYSIMRMLGVNIQRRSPAKTTVEFISTSSQVIIIPTLSKFIIGSNPFFNRSAIVLNPSQPVVQADLYQGDPSNIYSIASNGYPFQIFEIGDNDYSIANEDIYCYSSSGNIWKGVLDGLYKYSAKDLIFYQNSTAEGNVEIRFGNDLYGAIPPNNVILNFLYVTTLGSQSNNSATGLDVVFNSFNMYVPDRVSYTDTLDLQNKISLVTNSVKASTVTAITNGDDGRNKTFYQAVGPFLNSAKKGMIRKPEHRAVGLTYPGMVDILFRNQKDVAPYNRNLINVCYVTPLMQNGVLMTDNQWSDFVEFLNERQIWRLDWVLKQPEAITVDVNAKLYCNLNSNITNVVSYAEYNLRQKFGIQLGSLGYSMEKSDLYDILKLNYLNLQVDYVELDTPVSDITINPWQYIQIGNFSAEIDWSTRNYGNYVPPSTTSAPPSG